MPSDWPCVLAPADPPNCETSCVCKRLKRAVASAGVSLGFAALKVAACRLCYTVEAGPNPS
jgi:hypothetical protein